MRLCHPSEKGSVMDLQRSQSPPQKQILQSSFCLTSSNPSASFFPSFPAKFNSLFQDDQSPLTMPPDYVQSSYDFTISPRDSVHLSGLRHSPYPPLFPKNSRYYSFSSSFESNHNPYTSFSDIQCLDAYKDHNSEHYHQVSVDGFICSNEDLSTNNSAGQKEADPVISQELPTIEPEVQKDQGIQLKETEETPKPALGLKGWSEEDDKLLKKLVVQFKFDWKKITKKFGNKKYTAHFLKMRYKGHDEGPVPKRVKFTHEEDILIAKCFDEYGVDWEKMVSHFPNRTAIMIKNRYYSHIRKHNRLNDLLHEAGKDDETTSLKNETVSGCGDINNDNTENKPALGSDKSYSVKRETKSDENRISDEVALLKAQVKSLRSLYLVTYKELTRLRGTH